MLFTPEDLLIMKGAPAERRRTIDLQAGQINNIYFQYLQKYQRALNQRNHILKNKFYYDSHLDEVLTVWEQQLAEYGAKIIYQRLVTLHKLTPLLKKYHEYLTGGQQQLTVKYLASLELSDILTSEKLVAEIKSRFLKALSGNRLEELRRGLTLKGPHRDDFCFALDGKDLRRFGSQGQQRTMVLILKIAEAELIYQETGEYPVLLLDDVFSELDDQRRNYLLANIESKMQTFITAASLENEKQVLGEQGKKYIISQGKFIVKE